jgi:hypothetical protein
VPLLTLIRSQALAPTVRTVAASGVATVSITAQDLRAETVASSGHATAAIT